MLRVKQGRKYYLEGREYGPGALVEAYISPSYLPGLTNAFGPLENVPDGPMKGRAVNAGDMATPRVMTAPKPAQPQELQNPLASAPAPAAPPARPRRQVLQTKNQPADK